MAVIKHLWAIGGTVSTIPDEARERRNDRRIILALALAAGIVGGMDRAAAEKAEEEARVVYDAGWKP